MKNKLVLSVATVALIALLGSCSKAPAISPLPTLVITSPTASQTFAGGASLHIMGTATASGTDDAHLLHEMSLTVTKVSDGSQVWFADISVHDEASHVIDTSFTLPRPSVRDSFVLSALVVNHLLNNATQTVGFTVNP